MEYLMGVMLGDGGIYGKYYTVFCRDPDPGFSAKIAKLVSELLGIKPKIKRGNSQYVVYTCRKRIHDGLISLGMPKGRKLTSTRIPKFLLNDLESKRELVRGLMDAEGSVFLDVQKHGGRIYIYPVVSLDMIAKPILAQLRQILLEFGIHSNLYRRSPRAWGKHPQWRIQIKGEDQVSRFAQLIGFGHSQKAAKLAQILERVREGSSETIRQAPSRR